MKQLSISICIVMFWVSHSYAFCSRGFSISGDGTHEELKFLICLHNEQVRQINDLSDTVSMLSGEILRMEGNAEESARRIHSLENELRIVRDEIQGLGPR